MTHNVEIEYDKEEFDAFKGKRWPMLEWLVTNYGSGIDDEAIWNSYFDYKRSAPGKLLKVYSFKNSQDAMMFALRWS